MNNIITQPYRRPTNPAEDNYLTTWARDYDLSQHRAQLGPQYRVYERLHPSGASRLWATGTSRAGRSAFRAMQADDLVLLYGHGEVYSYGFITAKLYWPDNSHIWPSGTNWDHIYALRDVVELPPGQRPRTNIDVKPVLTNFAAQPVQAHDLASLGTSLDHAIDRIFASVDEQYRPTGNRLVPPPPATQPRSPLGTKRRPKPFTGVTNRGDVFVKDWENVERGNLGHQRTLDALEQLVVLSGLVPHYGVPEANFDLSWQSGSVQYVCEVKSLTRMNEDGQLRLGLGQALDYNSRVRRRDQDADVRPVLAVEQKPTAADHWTDVCERVGAVLYWAGSGREQSIGLTPLSTSRS